MAGWTKQLKRCEGQIRSMQIAFEDGLGKKIQAYEDVDTHTHTHARTSVSTTTSLLGALPFRTTVEGQDLELRLNLRVAQDLPLTSSFGYGSK